MTKHNKVQQYVFYSYIQKELGNEWLDKFVERLSKGIPLPVRNSIREIHKNGLKLDPNQAKELSLIYSLHFFKGKNGYLEMFIEEIKQELDEETIETIHKQLNELLLSLELPTLQIDEDFLKAVFNESEELKKRYERFIKT